MEEKVISFTGLEIPLSDFVPKLYKYPPPLEWYVISHIFSSGDYETQNMLLKWMQRNFTGRFSLTSAPVNNKNLYGSLKVLIFCEDGNDALRIKLTGLDVIVSDIKNNV